MYMHLKTTTQNMINISDFSPLWCPKKGPIQHRKSCRHTTTKKDKEKDYYTDALLLAVPRDA